MDKNLYDILDVAPSADADAIQAAYRQQMRLYHPDKVSALGTDLRVLAEARAKEINAAYATLGNPASRASYDRSRQTEQAPPLPEPPRPVARPPLRKERAVPPSPRSAPQQATGRFSRGAHIAGNGLIVISFAGAATNSSWYPDPIFHAAVLVILHASSVVVYAGMYLAFDGAIAATQREAAITVSGKLSLFLLRMGMILLSSFMALVVMVAFAENKISTGSGVLAGLIFLCFSILLLAKSVVPRRTDHFLSRFPRFAR